MIRLAAATALATAVVAASLAGSAYADPRERNHLHVGGGISFRPNVFTMQVLYPNIVYDESSADANATSLDVYTPDPKAEKAPVMVWVHGGGFRVSDKASSKDLGPKPEYFVSKLGYVLVSVNYHLLPEGQYPVNVQDVANALAWVHNNVAEFGGNPDQMFLMGHSAGAALVAAVSTDGSFLKKAGKDLTILKGVIANEGSYGADVGEEEAKRFEQLYGAQWRELVPVAQVPKNKGIAPFLLYHVTNDANTPPANSELQAQALAKVLKEAGIRAEVVQLDHVEHFGANERMGLGGDVTTYTVEKFLDSITGRPAPAKWSVASRGGPSR